MQYEGGRNRGRAGWLVQRRTGARCRNGGYGDPCRHHRCRRSYRDPEPAARPTGGNSLAAGHSPAVVQRGPGRAAERRGRVALTGSPGAHGGQQPAPGGGGLGRRRAWRI
jgi:hypothetical protein